MKMPPNAPAQNVPSSLLTADENQQVFQLLGFRCQSVWTSVIQLYYTQAPTHSQWVKKDTGVLCFVKDNVRKNYFFRLYCLKRKNILWEHEMYNDMEYFASTPYLHTFEGEDYMVAFNFASLEEAREMKHVVDLKIQAQKRREKRLKTTENHNVKIARSPSAPPIIKKKKDTVERLAKRKRNITKADIGEPLEFRHVAHVGFHPMTGFDVNCEDDLLTDFLKRAGVSKMQLEDKDTRDFIYDFISKNGGREAVEQEVKWTETKPVVKPPSPVSLPPVPPRGSTRSHNRAAPPPPPTPTQNLRQSPAVPRTPQPNNSVAPPPPPPIGNAPPPPPPPPPIPSGIPPPPAPPIINEVAKVDSRSALMESIREGANLKPVEVERRSSPDDTRSDLLSEIRKGFQLKPTTEREIKPCSPPVEQSGANDLASALAKALADRSRALHSEDDSTSDTDSRDSANEDEWDD